jgi:hypothetical protein
MKKIYLTFIVFSSLFFGGCETEYLTQIPKDQLVVETTFTSYSNIKAYAWGFYDTFPGFSTVPISEEFNGDLFLNSTSKIPTSDWIRQLVTIPATNSTYSGSYSNIRRINIMLDNIDKSNVLTQLEKNHWRSVGYFFRAYEYHNLVSRYGDVIWLEHALNDASPELFSPRTPRNEVTQNMLDNLLFAESHIKAAGDGPNSVGVHAVRALISRFGLFEGTWRKYHGLGDSEKYLRASVNASEKLMVSYPTLMPNYDLEFNSESLAGATGIILYKQYSVESQLTYNLVNLIRSSSGIWDLTKKAADMYLLKDGQTRWSSPLFVGDKDPYTEFRNRDKRMLFTISPPFRVNVANPATSWTYNADPKHREYLDLMATLSGVKQKGAPASNWQGLVLKQSPHFRDFNNGQGFNAGQTGYYFNKYYNALASLQNADVADNPIFRIAEVMVNYAEAKYELGEFNQSIANTTINKLRARGGVANLVVGSEPTDITRDPSVASTLWEIRRERAVELMGEGFRFNDLRRWKKMNYTDVEQLGCWVKNSDYGNKLTIKGGAAEGYVTIFGAPPGNFPDHYYLYPIPSNEIVLNPKMVQNPGWK